MNQVFGEASERGREREDGLGGVWRNYGGIRVDGWKVGREWEGRTWRWRNKIRERERWRENRGRWWLGERNFSHTHSKMIQAKQTLVRVSARKKNTDISSIPLTVVLNRNGAWGERGCPAMPFRWSVWISLLTRTSTSKFLTVPFPRSSIFWHLLTKFIWLITVLGIAFCLKLTCLTQAQNISVIEL